MNLEIEELTKRDSVTLRKHDDEREPDGEDVPNADTVLLCFLRAMTVIT